MKKAETIDEYISQYSNEIQGMLQQIRKLIRKEAPAATEKISYGLPTFYLNGNLVHFGAQKNHIGLYPTSSGVRNFEKELKNYEHSPGAIQFPFDRPIPYALIRKIVKFRVKETMQHTPKPKKKKLSGTK